MLSVLLVVQGRDIEIESAPKTEEEKATLIEAETAFLSPAIIFFLN